MKSVSEKKKNIYFIIAIALMAGLYCFTHLWKIEEVMSAWNVDEAGMGLDAIALKNYGTDRFGNSYPFYLTNFGGGQSALYGYLCALVLHFVNVSKLAFRLPGIIMMFIAAIYWCRTWFVLEDHSKIKSIVTFALISILPIYIMLFRIGMDCNLMAAVTPVFFFYIIRAVKNRKIYDYILAGISGGLVLYSYAVSYVVMVVFLLIMFIYILWTKKINIKECLAFVIPIAIMGAPLVFVQIVNMYDLEEFKIGVFTVTKLPFYRADEMKLSNITMDSIEACFRVINKYDRLRYNSVEEFGVTYYISIPFVVIGFIVSLVECVKSIVKRVWNAHTVYVVWFIILFFINSMINPNVSRMNAIFVPVLFFLVEGLFFVVDIVKNRYVKYSVSFVLVVLYLVCFVKFAVFYFGGEYIENYDPVVFCANDMSEALDYADYLNGLEDYRRIYVDSTSQTHVFFALSRQLDSYEFFMDSDGQLRSDYWWRYKEYILYTPDDVDQYGIYVLDQRCSEMIGKLMDNEFIFYKFGDYYVSIKNQ